MTDPADPPRRLPGPGPLPTLGPAVAEPTPVARRLVGGLKTRQDLHGPVSGKPPGSGGAQRAPAYSPFSMNGASHSGVTSAGKPIAWDWETSIAE